MVGVLAVIIVIGAAIEMTLAKKTDDLVTNISLANVEALADGESSDTTLCFRGGKGISTCFLVAGEFIGTYEVTAGCNVTCKEGYYACCKFRCICIKNQ
jgi:hypothetical protein